MKYSKKIEFLVTIFSSIDKESVYLLYSAIVR